MGRRDDAEREFLGSASAPLDFVLSGEPTPAPVAPGTEPSRMRVALEIDARGDHRPIPLVKAGRAIEGLAAGELLRVLTMDVGSLHDFQAFARATGHHLVEQASVAGYHEHVLRRR